jgi:hypothetical protein
MAVVAFYVVGGPIALAAVGLIEVLGSLTGGN